jgi:hypothetical protein
MALLENKVRFAHWCLPDDLPTNVNVAVTAGSGVQWSELYGAVAAQNRSIGGGFSPGGTVGAAGGWVLGGGHSVLSPFLGLGELLMSN